MTTLLVLFVPGHPRSKGSMKCIGARGKAKHVLQEQVTLSKPWRERMQRAIVQEVRRGGAGVGAAALPWTGPVRVRIGFYFDRPETGVGVSMPFPVIDAGVNAVGDLDKLTRNVLDALQGSGLIKNDCLVVGIVAEKRWVPNGLGPGVQITVETV